MLNANHPNNIKIHSLQEYSYMRQAGKMAAEVLDYIGDFVKPGVKTITLDQLCHDKIISAGAIPAPLNYKGYTKSICTSVNHVVCHGVPGEKMLQEGDIVNIDVTVIVDGWHGDSSRMYYVGNKIPIKAQRLCNFTYDAMMKAIEIIKPGIDISEIGKIIEEYAREQGYSVVRDFCGHGIGAKFHMPPNVMHYYDPEISVKLEPGMFFTVEPMINVGKHHVKILNDGWTAVTRDKSLSAQFEHTIGVTEEGCEIFTISPAGKHFPKIYTSTK